MEIGKEGLCNLICDQDCIVGKSERIKKAWKEGFGDQSEQQMYKQVVVLTPWISAYQMPAKSR